MPRAYGGPMFLGLLAAPDLFVDDRVLLSYLAITHDIFSFLFSPPFQREKIYSYEYIEYGRAFCFVFSLRRLFALFFFFFFLIETII